MKTTLTLTTAHHQMLMDGLYRDYRERVGFILAGRCRGTDRHRLLGREVHLLPETAYHSRRADGVHWSTDALEPLLDRAAKEGLALVKIHTHPGGFASFSAADDRADAALFPSVHGWVDDGFPHVSAIALPDGRIIARTFSADGGRMPAAHVAVIGDELRVWPTAGGPRDHAELSAARNVQAFGEATHALLRRLRIAVVGASGTGSIVAELLSRLLVGEIVLVDSDRVEECNLNRIVGATRGDVGRHKTDVLADSIGHTGLGVSPISVPYELSDPRAIAAVASADVVFGCVDSIDGRHLLNRLATYYLLPYFDIGIRLDARDGGGIAECVGSVHYLQPGRSSLRSRGVYTAEQLRAASLRRHDPEGYAALRREKYIVGANEHRPAVAPVNMYFASRAVLDLLARVHPFRLADPPDAWWTESLASGVVLSGGEESEPIDQVLQPHVGEGDANPALGLPLLGEGTD